MQEFFWAIGSSMVLLLILTFIPLGLTLKGKFSIMIVAFILAELGQVAVTTFSLWQTALILVVVIFFSSYFMHNRMRFSLFKNIAINEKGVVENETVVGELGNFKNSYIEKQKDTSVDYLGSETASNTTLKDAELDFDKNIGAVVNEDISFLLDETEDSDIKEVNLEQEELGYLADIESMLTGELVTKEKVNEEVSWIDELEDLLPTSGLYKMRDLNSSFEVFTGLKEAAASKQNDEKEIIKIGK